MTDIELWRWERKWLCHPTYFLERVSQPWWRRGTQVNPSKLLKLRKQSWHSEKTKQIDCAWQSAREERMQVKKIRDVYSVPLEYWSAQACVETTVRSEKESPKMIRGNSAQCLHGIGNSACRLENVMIHGTLGRVLRKVLPQ